VNTNPRARKVGLFGIFGAGNLGNECTLQAMLSNVRRYIPDADICCICSGPEAAALEYGVSAVDIRQIQLPPISNRALRMLRRILVAVPVELYRWFKALATLRDMDMLLMTGTGMLGDFGILPFDLHYDILRWSVAARLCRCKLLFVSVGVGPILHPLSRCFVKAALALANYRSYRDKFSKEYLESIGFETNRDVVYPDLAFSLPSSMTRRSLERNGHETAVIGVGLMTYYNKRSMPGRDEAIYREYIARVAKLVTGLIQRKFAVRLLIGDIIYDNRVREDLRSVLEASGVRYDGTTVMDQPATSFDEVLSQLAGTDIVVASRFHNVLLALMLTKPVVAISYHEKVRALMAGVGLAEYCQDIEYIDIDKVLEQVTLLRDNARTLKPTLERKTEAYRQDLDQQYDYMFGKCIDRNRSL
jgi:polysaccharide pyruvyl transferase WcaK-like protein